MRSYRKSQAGGNRAEMIDRCVCASTYIIFWIGMIWLIVNGIKRIPVKTFVKFHIYQSLFIWIMFSIIAVVYKIVFAFIVYIPLINYLVGFLDFYILKYPVFLGFSIAKGAFFIFIAILAVRSFNGKHTEIPWITSTIRQLM